ncbi:hypothetical protein L596_023409 [Steinernema carpocapsae]|uniref:MCM N-terminal domain-containing protein n=1 Tax=Steinernema carpocapsae TaxID=34508 RepID=A0A4U5MDL6_STECR|nr:hypothetical protein L596_023409 [Steinernema carpocapsae]
MSNFDNPGLYYQERFYANDAIPDEGQEMVAEYKQSILQFKKFLHEFNREGHGLFYREQLKRNYNLKQYNIDVCLNDLKTYDEGIATKLRSQPPVSCQLSKKRPSKSPMRSPAHDPRRMKL